MAEYSEEKKRLIEEEKRKFPKLSDEQIITQIAEETQRRGERINSDIDKFRQSMNSQLMKLQDSKTKTDIMQMINEWEKLVANFNAEFSEGRYDVARRLLVEQGKLLSSMRKHLQDQITREERDRRFTSLTKEEVKYSPEDLIEKPGYTERLRTARGTGLHGSPKGFETEGREPKRTIPRNLRIRPWDRGTVKEESRRKIEEEIQEMPEHIRQSPQIPPPTPPPTPSPVPTIPSPEERPKLALPAGERLALPPPSKAFQARKERLQTTIQQKKMVTKNFFKFLKLPKFGRKKEPEARAIPLGSQAGVNKLPSSGIVYKGQPPQRLALPPPSTPEEKKESDKLAHELNEIISEINSKRDKSYFVRKRLEKLRQPIVSVDELRTRGKYKESIPLLRNSVQEAENILRELERPAGGVTGGPPAPPTEGRREERESPPGRITGKIIDKTTNIPPTEITRVQADSPYITRPFDIPVNEDGTYQITVPARTGGIEYSVTAIADLYKKPRPKVVVVEPGKSVEVNFELEQDPRAKFRKEREKETEEKKWKEEEKQYKTEKRSKLQTGLPFFTSAWFKDFHNWWRFGVAVVSTIAAYFILYKPLFDALGFSNAILSIILPILTGFIIFFSIPKPKPDERYKWGAIILAIVLSLGTMAGLYFAPFTDPDISFLRARYFLFGVPLAVFFITWKMAGDEKSGGLGKTLIKVGGILLLIGFIVMFVNLAKGGELTKIDTYLKTLDVLKLVGVPADAVENMKSGVKDTLSFLQFKGAESTKPEAKKIGGFEAIQLKFGSTYNDFLLPTLFARMEYTLPLTVINPNKFDTKLVVEKFNITNVFLNNKNTDRTICGSTSDGKAEIELGDISPEEERIMTIQFNNKTDCKHLVATSKGYTIGTEDYDATNPMFPAIFRLPYRDPSPDVGDKISDCKEVCQGEGSIIVLDHNQRYGLTPGNELDADGSKYILSDEECECRVKRYHNVLDELCFLEGDKARITMGSSYGFKVQGKGELILLKTETDRKLAPKPTITSSAGPLTITTYFVSDIHIPGKSRTSIMFIQITNDGDGSANINQLKINGGSTAQLEGGMVKISQCQPSGAGLSVGKETITLACQVEIVDADVNRKVTGAYLTVPVIVDINYTYSQTHSTTINVKKESIPDSVIDKDEIIELNKQFKLLPYYCPTKSVNDRDDKFDTDKLKIYNTECRDFKQDTCGQLSSICEWDGSSCKDKSTP